MALDMEQVASTLVSEIEVDGVSGKQPAHEGGKAGSARSQQKVKVVGHERPGKAFGASLHQKFGEVPDKPSPVVIVTKDVATLHTTDDDMLQEIGDI